MESDIKKIIEEFLHKMSLGFNSLSGGLDMDSGDFWFSVETNDSRFLIGKDGENLQSINYIIKRIIENKYKENTPRVTVDVNNYQKSNIDKIKTIAHMMAERARFFKSKIELPAMNAFERRIVHEYVSAHKDLKSESDGFGKNRHVTISFVKDNL